MFFKQSIYLVLLVSALGCRADRILTPYPVSATEAALKWQPYLKIASQGCYQSVAIGVDGKLNDGIDPNGPVVPNDKAKRAGPDVPGDDDILPPEPPPPPHAGWQLARDLCRNHRENSQTYVRQRCNHGWCAYLYGYYFEADINPLSVIESSAGHRHDWEHIIVWTLNDQIFYVSWSGHGGWTTERDVDLLFQDDSHPLLMYERGPQIINNHRIRKGVQEDGPGTSEWYRAPLLSLEMARCDRVTAMLNNNWGDGHPELHKDRFGKALDEAMPEAARVNEHFDPFLSDYDHE